MKASLGEAPPTATPESRVLSEPSGSPPAAGPSGSPPAAAAANLWVVRGERSCTRSDAPVDLPGAASPDARCGSFSTAYAASRSGDLILVRNPEGGDDYGPQSIPDGRKAVTIRSETGRAELGHTVVSAENVLVEDFVVENRGNATDTCGFGLYGVLTSCGEHATYDGVVIDGLMTCSVKRHGIIFAGGSSTFRNGEIKNVLDMKGAELSGEDMVLDNVYWHDIRVRNRCGDDVHNECLYVQESPDLVVRNNRFIECPTMAIFFTNWGQEPPSPEGGSSYGGYRLMGNLITYTHEASGARHRSSCAVVLGSFRIAEYEQIKIKYNTIDSCVTADVEMPDGGGNEMVGNAGGYGCPSQFANRHNFGPYACPGVANTHIPGDCMASGCTGEADSDGPDAYGWRDPRAFDYSLTADSQLLGAGDPSDFPQVDLLGTRRASPPDAGAYEYDD